MGGALTLVETMLRGAVGEVFPAAQLLVVDGGEVRLDASVGACSAQTLFDLASLTKPLSTAAITMRLLARGVITLEQRPRSRVSIHHLLCHAAGLPAWRSLGDAESPSAVMRAHVVEAARREPLEYSPGTRSIYSDLGYILLGDALERATDARLDHLFAEEVAVPLGVDLAFAPEALEGDVAPTEGKLVGVVHDDNARAMCGIAGHAGLFGHSRAVSAAVSAWVAAWHGDAGWLDPKLVRRAFENAGIAESTWGLGWDHPSPTGSSAGETWSKSGVGHLGYTGCSIWIDPPKKRWVVLLTNRVHPTRKNEAIKTFRPKLHEAIVAALP